MSISSPTDTPPLDGALITELEQRFGADAVLSAPADCWPYGYDNSRRQGLPQAVVFATRHDEVVDLVCFCHEHRLPLIARGKGTGTTGATVPLHGGIVLSLERMARIVDIDPGNRIAQVEPGVTNRELQQALAPHGFFWPPDPTSAAVCTLGGNLAYNSAGPHAVKYGTPRENTLGLTAVTGLGETLHTGVRTTKGVVGYDLTRLLIGSEGTLAVITGATLKLTPLPETRRTLRIGYRDIHSAARAVSAIMAQPVTPSALEFMDGGALELVRSTADLSIDPDIGALLLVEVDGLESCIEPAVARVTAAARNPGMIDLHGARPGEETVHLWRARSALSPALRKIAPKKINEDVVVPVSRIPDLIEGLEGVARDTGIRIINFGHAGNGNIHVNLLFDPDDPTRLQQGRRALDALFDLVLALGGTLSGEHGVGLEKRDFVSREIDPVTLRLMTDLKRRFDPRNILNPGKALPPV